MNKAMVYMIVLIGSSSVSHAMTLDRSGLLQEPPIVCTASSIKGGGTEQQGEYAVEGSCKASNSQTYYFKGGAKYFRKPGYSTDEAKEFVEVFGDAAKSNKLGGIATRAQCDKNPFIGGGANCTPTHYLNDTGVNLTSYNIPFMFGLMANLPESTGSTGQALQSGQSQPNQELSDWNPYANDPQAKCIAIAAPGNNVYILAAKPPGFNARIVLIPKAQAPGSLFGEFQKAKLTTQVGDIKTSKLYPESWHTITAPLFPSSAQQWSLLPDAPGYTNGKQVNLYTGVTNAPFTPGYFRVRVKANDKDCNWEPWRYFWITAGINATATAGLAPGGALGFGSKAQKVQPRAKRQKVQPRATQGPQLAKVVPGNRQTEQQKPAAPRGAMTPGARMADSQLAKAGTLAITKPNLWIDKNQGVAMIVPELNKTFGIGLYVKNTGNAENKGATQGKLTLSCLPADGCQSYINNVQLPTIAPGQSKSVNAQVAFKITKPGNYQVTAKLEPGPSGRAIAGLAGSWSKNVSVQPKINMDAVKKIPTPVMPRATQPNTDDAAKEQKPTIRKPIPMPIPR